MKVFHIQYKTFDPTGNRTMIVTTPVDREDHSKAAGGIMDHDRSIEQVAFIEEGNRLQMMGGEFCGNASLSYAAMLAEQEGKDAAEYSLDVSGAEEKVSVSVEKKDDGYFGKVSMPLPLECKVKNFGRYKLPLIKFNGISHTIVTERIPQALAQMLIREWASKARAEAFGILMCSADYTEMTPIVFVKSTDTVVIESSCASGTAAVGAYLALERKEPVKLEIRQPGGVLSVEAAVEGDKVSSLVLGGQVKCVDEGEMDVEEKIIVIKKD